MSKPSYIERQAAIDNVIWAKENHMDEVEAIECTIAADVAPVRHGRYCPHCGALMDLPEPQKED